MKIVDFLREVGQAVTFFPGIARMVGRNECLFVVQLMYWKREDRDWTWKTQEAIEKATSLTPGEQRRVRDNLKAIGILREKYVRGERRVYFQVDETRFNELWEKHRSSHGTSLVKSRHVTCQVTARNMLPSEKSRKNIIREPINKEPGRGFSETSFEDKCVKHLVKTVRLKFKVTKDGKNWQKAFSQLQRYDGVKKERIKAALIWYRDNAGNKYVPVIEDAQSFRKRFISLESRLRDEQPETKEPLKLSKGAKEVLKDLSNLSWSVDDSNLPDLVQASLVNYQKWWKKLRAFDRRFNVRESKDPRRMIDFDADTFQEKNLCMFHGHINENLWQYPTDFIRIWWTRINDKLHKWNGFSGKLDQFIFHIDHPEMLKRGRQIAKDYSSEASVWNDYIDAINES
jgi:hypothetical protein